MKSKIAMKPYKTFYRLILVGLIFAMITTSCRDEFSQEDALSAQRVANDSSAILSSDLELQVLLELELLRDSLRRAGGVIVYTVQLLDASTSSFFSRTKGGVAGATVTGIQNGAAFTASDEGNGLYVFPDMRIGEIAINVQAAGFTEVNYIADITPDDQDFGGDFNDSNTQQQYQQPRNAATQIGLFDLDAATVSGTLTGEVDLTNGQLDTLANQVVFVRLDSVPDLYWSTATTISGTDGNLEICDCGAGRVLEIAYDANTTGTTDANGLFTLPIPASARGDIEVSIVPNEIVTNRIAYEFSSATNGVLTQTSRTTIWGVDITNDVGLANQLTDVVDETGSTITSLATGDDEFNNLVITTSTPVPGSGATVGATHFPGADPVDPADDFIQLNLTAGGSGYLDDFDVLLRLSGGGGPTQDLILESNDGAINIEAETTNGRLEDPLNANTYPVNNFSGDIQFGNYTSAPSVTVFDDYPKAAAIIYAVVDGSGNVTDLNVIFGGVGYPFNSGNPITSITDALTGGAAALTVVFDGFTSFNDVLPTGTGVYIITGGASGYITGNDFGNLAQGTWGTAAINPLTDALNPESGRSYIYNIHLGGGQVINTFGI